MNKRQLLQAAPDILEMTDEQKLASFRQELAEGWIEIRVLEERLNDSRFAQAEVKQEIDVLRHRLSELPNLIARWEHCLGIRL